MRGKRWFTIGSLVLAYGMAAGCQTAGAPKPIVTTEPGLAGPVYSDATVIAADGMLKLRG